jgi:hypothetical protein
MRDRLSGLPRPGFGGACVAICDADRIGGIAGEVPGDYRRLGGRGRLLAAPELLA